MAAADGERRGDSGVRLRSGAEVVDDGDDRRISGAKGGGDCDDGGGGNLKKEKGTFVNPFSYIVILRYLKFHDYA